MKTPLRTIRLAFAIASLLWVYVVLHPPAEAGRAKAPAQEAGRGRPPMALVLPDPAPNDFAVSLYRQLGKQPGNLFFSPFSIRAALGMARTGARGRTASQMAEALGEGGARGTSTLDVEQISKRLRHGGRGELTVANSLWAQEGAAIRPEFTREIASRYHGELKTADFARDASGATDAINQWVEERTKGRIQGLIPTGGLDDRTRLVLANTVYFKGLWERKFDRGKTRDETFYLEGGRTVKAPLMRQEEEIAYMEGDGYQAVDLAYRGEDLSMLLLLPRRRDGLRDLEARLSGDMLHACAEQLEIRKVRCTIPRFTFTSPTTDLRAPLAALGMTLPFDRTAADFSGINGLRPPSADALFITSVFHKAFMEVNEEGTEAAASTGVGFGLVMAPPPPPEFRADHPFLFAIRDRKSGAILFLGRVADPS